MIVEEQMEPYNKFMNRLERQMLIVQNMERSLRALQAMNDGDLVRCEMWINEPEGVDCTCGVEASVLRLAISGRLPREEQTLATMLQKVKGIFS